MSVLMECHCGDIYIARQGDLDRGWGLSCSKRCAAIRRDFGRKAAKRVDGNKIKQNRKKPSTHRYRRYDEVYNQFENWGHPFADGYEGHGQY